MQLDAVCALLEKIAPPMLAESWDNVGLLVGDPTAEIQRIMTCLTITPRSADEACRRQADLIVSHHPLPFRPLKRLTTESVPGRLLWQLAGQQIAIYSPHTSFDSASGGINRQLADGLQLTDVRALVEQADSAGDVDALGAGRWGSLPQTLPLGELADRLKSFLRIDQLRGVGDPAQPIQTVAVACGSAGEFLAPARDRGCDLLITGETTFHTCLDAEANNISLLLTGHYASERFALEKLAAHLAIQLPQLEVWASQHEADPLSVF